ncbi:MAG: sulfite exporter TauE/SafE family protein [Syntrophales bacterium]
MMENIWLIPLGFVIGTLGTLIGAGGGFILVPILLLLYPSYTPETITSMSLAVVFFNALSGSYAYSRMGRIEYRSGIIFSAATIPGAILGAITTAYIPRRLFDSIFGVLLLLLAVFLIVRPAGRTETPCLPNHRKCTVIERDGTEHHFFYNQSLGVSLSVAVGYFSSLLGIGGGIIHVPVLVRLLNFPVHIATATSHFVLANMALAGTITHIATGSFHQGVHRTLLLSAGVLLGAQAGALISTRIHGNWIIRALALALGAVGVRLVMTVIG